MPEYKGFEHYYRKAITSHYRKNDAILYAAKKHAIMLFEKYSIDDDDELCETLVGAAFTTYDHERNLGVSHKAASMIATDRMKSDLKKILIKQDNRARAHTRDRCEQPRGGKRGGSAFEGLNGIYDSLPHDGRSSHYEEDARHEERSSRRPTIRVKVQNRHQDQRPRPHPPPLGATQPPYFPPFTGGGVSSPTFCASPFGGAPPHAGLFTPPFSGFPPMPTGTGKFSFPPPQFSGSADNYTRQSQYSTSTSYSNEPPSDRSYNTQEYRPSGNAWNAPPRPSFDTRHTEYTYSSNPPPRPSYGTSHSDNYHRGDNSSRTYTSNAPPPRSSRTRSPPRSYENNIKPKTCFYTVLGLPRSASANEIRKAYHKQSLKYHPDRATGGTEKMAEINQANDVLSDDKKRAFYDHTGYIPPSRGV